jgi:transcriptional regulator with XRE-family HTH domain
MEDREIADIVFGRLLRAHREGKGYSQEELGMEAGLTRNYISLLELGQRSPTLRTIVKLAKCFGISVGELIAQFDVAYERQIKDRAHLFISSK